MRKRSSHPMVDSLATATGNPKACMYTEPLWGIPFNLYAPFASVYMIALGLTDSTIGLIATVGLALQVVFSLLGGPITDKIGRKRTTFIFDVISWTVPVLLWAFARNAAWFYIAAIFNSLYRVTMTSWICLFIEDAPKSKMVHYWAWVQVAGTVAGLVAPLAGLLIDRFELIPTMRAIYLFAAVSMTAKFVVLNAVATETRQGEVRMRETSTTPFLTLVWDSLRMFKVVFSARGTVAAVALLAAAAIYATVRGTFFAVLLTQGLGFSPEEVGWFPAARSAVILTTMFLVIPRLHQERHVGYLVLGFLLTIAGTLLLIISPQHSYFMVFSSTILEAMGAALLAPYIEGFVAAIVDPGERARILAVANTVVLAVASPFGWIAGALSEIGKTLPFVLIVGVLALTVLFLVIRNPEKVK